MKASLTLTAIIAVCIPICSLGADIFSFGGQSWDQTHTPDRISFVGEGQTRGGAVFSEGLPQEVTRSVDFPKIDKGFDPRLSIGYLDGTGSGARALNLPLFNEGSMMRHGISLSWSENRMGPNLQGPDFLVFESGEGVGGGKDSRGPELFMVRVRNAATQQWSPWIHKGTNIFHAYNKRTAAGAYITAYDLDEFGLSFGDSVDRLEIANMVRSDMIGGSKVPFMGPVIFNNRDRLGVRPRPRVPFVGSYEQNLLYSPDLLYVAFLQKPLKNPFSQSGKVEEKITSIPKKTLSSREALADEVLLLLAVEGQVSIFENETDKFLPTEDIFLNMSIAPGYSILTGDDSAVTLLLPDGGILILQPGSLVSLDRVATIDKTVAENGPASTKFMIHLIRGAFLLSNQTEQGEASFELDAGRAGIKGVGGVIYFQLGEPLRGNRNEEAGKVRKRYFELKTGMLGVPAEGKSLTFVAPVPRNPTFAPPNINPSNLPSDFSPYNLSFQGLAWLKNPIIPDGTNLNIGDGDFAYFDPDKFFRILIPGGNTDGGGQWGGASGNSLGDMIGDDGRLALNPDAIDAIARDPYIQKLFNLAGQGNVRLMLDGSGNPVFILEDGTEIKGVNAPDTVKQLLADNPAFGDLLDLSAEGVQVLMQDDGSLVFQLEDGGKNIPGINGDIQLTLDEDGNMVFLPDDGVSLPDILPPGIIGDTSSDQVVVKRPEGIQGMLRRAHAQRMSQINTAKAKKTAVTTNQQRAAAAAKSAQLRAQQRASRK
ncbi:MAG: hypothetical protein HN675_03945 [Opitutae bacterium]|nr:hypothetical protein [Opitutae bacterium]